MKQEEIEALQYELNIVLEALLITAGVKKTKLDEAVQNYIECIDKIEEDDDKEGVDEVLKAIKYLKTHHQELFN
ncbi:hypothetical protein [Campylobacter sp. MIT 97-5078]|uniref:hypothetical protein n=1 Tax=Campylobacter sp. MIT 97-5078 TaxID=1548153 RepID=UPI000512DAAD|nr:hypothetical protein [Campylobacter sp. MIT 97-5078]KGI56774.1 cell division protein [Campylobacter sp. MIT 97-5078]KGI57245.1 cell division protein [Campylobacter sp. MIT 97-5078]TQR27625.1 hypothetical protein DMB91_03260 [Campylobacter sp. MIT 97-5078]